MRAAKQEFWLVAALAALAFIGARFLEHDATPPAIAALVYLGWHGFNVARLLRWLGAPRFSTPFSFGVWEHVFDRLQAINLRHRRRKRSLFRLLRQLSLVLGGIDDAVVLFDDHGRVRWFNAAANRLLGLGRSATPRRPITEIIDHPLLTGQFGVGQDRRAAEMVSPVNRAVILRLEVAKLEDAGQRLLIARDVTKTHHLERARRDFVANVSHELRTPLTVFRGYLEELTDELGERSDLAGPIGQLDQQTTRMQSLVEELLDLSRVEFAERSSRTTEVDVPALVVSIVAEVAGLAATRRQELVENIDHRLGLAGNAAILRMIFANLINNALNHAGVDARIAVTWRREDNEAIFQIMDNGRGIEAEHLPRLTERFYRADSGRSRESGGTGLGLAIVKHALERHDAALHIESAPGEGSAFTCRFPAMRVVGLAARPSLIRRGRRRDVTLC